MKEEHLKNFSFVTNYFHVLFSNMFTIQPDAWLNKKPDPAAVTLTRYIFITMLIGYGSFNFKGFRSKK